MSYLTFKRSLFLLKTSMEFKTQLIFIQDRSGIDTQTTNIVNTFTSSVMQYVGYTYGMHKQVLRNLCAQTVKN